MSDRSDVGLVVFTRDLRVHDNPALVAAARGHGAVVPAFVLDDAILGSTFNRPNRTGFLLECLEDLQGSLGERGAPLAVRRGEWVSSVLALAGQFGVRTVHLADDVSGYAQRRLARLRGEAARGGVQVEAHPGITAVPPGELVPSGGSSCFQVFTPYHRQWSRHPVRSVLAPPRRLLVPDGLEAGRLPSLRRLVRGRSPGGLVPGGEAAGRRRLRSWLGSPSALGAYGTARDRLAEEGTSRFSPYLHFGCLSPLEVVEAARGRDGAESFIRQVCWRDFYGQLLAARPELAWANLRGAPRRFEGTPRALAVWREGRTGYPVVDAAMRQLQAEGWMHNRARMAAASFLTKDLDVDWRLGARHFLDLLVDGDIANNNLNWQWVAGTGGGSRPGRALSPVRQGLRFDPDGAYVRRYVPELASVPGGRVHRLDDDDRRRLGYPQPIVDHDAAVARLRRP